MSRSSVGVRIGSIPRLRPLSPALTRRDGALSFGYLEMSRKVSAERTKLRVGVEQAGQRRERDDVALVSVHEVLASLRGPCKVVGKPRVCAAERGTLRLVLIILGVILLVAAVAGGIAVHGLLWLLLILALVVFAIGALTGRITE